MLGLIRENMTEVQRAQIEAHMPPPVQQMWINVGNAAFDEFMSRLR